MGLDRPALEWIDWRYVHRLQYLLDLQSLVVVAELECVANICMPVEWNGGGLNFS